MPTQLADLLTRVPHPLYETLLMYPFYRPRANTRVEQRPVGRRFRSTEPTEVRTGRVRVHHCWDSVRQLDQRTAKVDVLLFANSPRVGAQVRHGFYIRTLVAHTLL